MCLIINNTDYDAMCLMINLERCKKTCNVHVDKQHGNGYNVVDKKHGKCCNVLNIKKLG
jgi:hypothetical protein